jgi:hypothetical protein
MTIHPTTLAMLQGLSNILEVSTSHRAFVANYLRPTERDDARRAVDAWLEAGCPDSTVDADGILAAHAEHAADLAPSPAEDWDLTDEGEHAIYTLAPDLVPASVTARVIYELRKDIDRLNSESMEHLRRAQTAPQTETYGVAWGALGSMWYGEVAATSESGARQAWIDMAIEGGWEMRPLTPAEQEQVDLEPGGDDHLFVVSLVGESARVVPAVDTFTTDGLPAHLG